MEGGLSLSVRAREQAANRADIVLNSMAGGERTVGRPELFYRYNCQNMLRYGKWLLVTIPACAK